MGLEKRPKHNNAPNLRTPLSSLLSAPSSQLPPRAPSAPQAPKPPKLPEPPQAPQSPLSPLSPRKPRKPRELCFHEVQAALLPTRLVSEVPCGLAHHAGTEVACFHCKSSASIKPKLHYCQPGWFQRFFVAWLTTLIRSDLLPLQELCFHEVQAALLPASLVPEVPCGLAHHAGTEVTCFHCKSCASIKPKLHYCQPGWFQRFFVAWLMMLSKRWSLIPLHDLCFHVGPGCALVPTRLVSEVLCGLAHDVCKRWSAITARLVFSRGPGCPSPNQAGFRGSLLPGCLAHDVSKRIHPAYHC